MRKDVSDLRTAFPELAMDFDLPSCVPSEVCLAPDFLSLTFIPLLSYKIFSFIHSFFFLLLAFKPLYDSIHFS